MSLSGEQGQSMVEPQGLRSIIRANSVRTAAAPIVQLNRPGAVVAVCVEADIASARSLEYRLFSSSSWRWLFAGNIPIGIGRLFARKKISSAQPEIRLIRSRDTLLSSSMFGFRFIGIDLSTRGGNVWIGTALGFARGIRPIFHSRSQSEPIVPFDLLRNPLFSLSVAKSIASLRCWRSCRCPSFFRECAAPKPGGNRATDDAVAAGGWNRRANRRAPRRQSVGLFGLQHGKGQRPPAALGGTKGAFDF